VTAEASFSGRLRVALWCLIITACALWAYEIPNRGIDPDELEHLHAAFCISRDDVPYRDFFEHHAPALYYLTLALLKVYGPQISVLWAARALMAICSLATLWLTGRLARRWGGERAALLAMALLAWTTVFHSKGIEFRPDVPATLLLLVAVGQFNFATGGGSWRRFLAVGLLLGLALLFTQKSIVPAAGITAAACLARLVSRSPESESALTVLARVVVPIAAGIAVIWGITSALFAKAGAINDFWYSTWYQLWIWPVHSNRWEHLRPTLAGDLTVWVAAIVEMCLVLREWRKSETWQQQRGAAALVALVCVMSLGFVKATYPQFYLLWMPLLAALAANLIIAVFDRTPSSRDMIAALAFALLLCLGEVFLWERAIIQGENGALPHLTSVVPVVVLVFAGCGLSLALVAVSSIRKVWPRFIVICAGIGMGYGVLRDIDTALWSNRNQVAAIDAVNRQVPVDGRVLDGFTGYGVLRPHAWYYWWINEYSLALVPEDELRTGLLVRLQKDPPAAVLFDQNLERLPENVQEWIRENYQPADPAVLWLRRPPPEINE
jgi:hypothetical protein